VAVDGLALLAFVVTGVWRHRGDASVGEVARTALPFLGSWFVLSPFLRTYARPGWRTLVLTWAVAVPAAVIVWALLRGEPWNGDLLVFLGVALAFTLLFLLAGRAVLVGVARARRRA
jgi:hypothetical protein